MTVGVGSRLFPCEIVARLGAGVRAMLEEKRLTEVFATVEST